MGCLDSLIEERVAQINSCCCGCRLSDGVRFVGWIQLIVGALAGLASFTAIVLLSMQVSNVKEGTSLNFQENSLVNHNSIVASYWERIIVAAVIFVNSSWAFFMGIILLLGLHKNKNKMVEYWLKAEILMYLFGLILALLNFFSKVNTEPSEAFVGIIGILIFLGIKYYFIVVVKSYYTQQERPRVHNQLPLGVPIIM